MGFSSDKSKSAIDQAIAATLGSIDLPSDHAAPIPSMPEGDEDTIESRRSHSSTPEIVAKEYRTKKEAIEAFKELLREKVKSVLFC